MTGGSSDVDPFEALLAELKPEVIAPKVIEPTADIAVLDPEETSTILRLSIRESSFRLTGDTVVELGDAPLKVVILKAAPVSRMYYSEAYADGQSKPPTCWSTDAGGGVPAMQVPTGSRQASDFASKSKEERQNILTTLKKISPDLIKSRAILRIIL